MINFNYENIKKAYKQHLFEQEIKSFLKREYGIEERPIKKVAKKPELKKQVIEEEPPVVAIKENKVIKPSSTKEKISELNEFLQTHSKRVGKEQALKDLQRGLNILTGYKKEHQITEIIALKEDGILGNKTKSFLEKICSFYPLLEIKRAIKDGAFNNVYAEYCWGKKKINLDKKLTEVNNNLPISRKGEK
ncbi:MAG: hypothetical protein OIF36_01230 [Alphaproteobacteria bacterium]|nr:hypothetical protein [Alphaproteobacteria bacterium]